MLGEGRIKTEVRTRK